MSLFSWFKPKESPFTPQETALSVQVRQEKREIARQKEQLDLELYKLKVQKEKIELENAIADAQADLQELTEGPEESTGGDMADTLLLGLFTKMMAGQTQNAPQIPQINHISDQNVGFSDQEISELLGLIPEKYLKIGKNLPENQVKSMIKTKIPSISDQNLDRLYKAFMLR